MSAFSWPLDPGKPPTSVASAAKAYGVALTSRCRVLRQNRRTDYTFAHSAIIDASSPTKAVSCSVCSSGMLVWMLCQRIDSGQPAENKWIDASRSSHPKQRGSHGIARGVGDWVLEF